MTVQIFTTPNCVQCNATKRQFDKLGIVYDSIDLTQHPEQLEQFKESGLTQSPIVLAEGQSWSGFRIEKINALAIKLKTAQ